MNKIISISFAFLIFLSGMHLSIATHFCGGEVAAVKWSFAGENASCDMETKQTCLEHEVIDSNCCHNEMAVYAVDDNYNPSSFQIKEVTKKVLQVFNVPASLLFHSIPAINSFENKILPPGLAYTSAVNLADICIFRI